MNSLDRRDRRRAMRLIITMWPNIPIAVEEEYIVKIAAALRREREEAQAIAMNWFLVYPKNPKNRINIVKDVAKARRAIKRGAKVSA